MKHTISGKTGLGVSRIASGTWQSGGEWGPTGTTTAAIRRAADKATTFFDTALTFVFGQSERPLAAALRPLSREELVIATEGGLRSPSTGVVRDQIMVDVTPVADPSPETT